MPIDTAENAAIRSTIEETQGKEEEDIEIMSPLDTVENAAVNSTIEETKGDDEP